jgi:TolB protein
MNHTTGKIRVLILICIFSVMTTAHAQDLPLGIFENHLDIGKVKLPGSAEYDKGKQEYHMEGSGKNIWFDRDEFHFLYKKIKGDFLLTATVEFIGKGIEPHRKIGWMVRNSLDTCSAHASAVLHGDGLSSLQYRRTACGETEEIRSGITGPAVVQLERKGNAFIMSVAQEGESFTVTELSDLALNDDVYAGLFICSHNAGVLEKAVFRNVRITLPAPEGFVPYRDYIGSNLEILDVESGRRILILHTQEAIQAPNWTTDGKKLIYNSDGLLFAYNLEKGTVSKINTGFATANNNDHVLSFDGKMLGISNHSENDNGLSIVYTLPVEGCDNPVRITALGPSYLHGWSPDGRYLIFTGARNDKYDIYKIPVSTKEEIRLTDTDGLDDGAEYTPDGKYIYFNSNRTGMMQIWRMNPDGSKPTQITSDGFNDWFPHVSPDGRWIVFLSYNLNVNSGDHPYYKHVYLRMMPSGGGKPKIIAYVYGGQGTLNVPSWSPDSKRIAFISNTQ